MLKVKAIEKLQKIGKYEVRHESYAIRDMMLYTGKEE